MKRFSEIKVHNITVEKIQKELNPLINSFKNAESFEEQDKIFKKINKIMDDLQTDISIIYVRYTINTTDAKYKKLQEHLSS
jgi:oligoendopeptidase F